MEPISEDFIRIPSSPTVVHHDVRCGNCQRMPIVDIRYKCTVCESFNLCGDCEIGNKHSHDFIKMKQAETDPKWRDFVDRSRR